MFWEKWGLKGVELIISMIIFYLEDSEKYEVFIGFFVSDDVMDLFYFIVNNVDYNDNGKYFC